MRNLQSKVGEEAWPEFREAARAAYQAPSPQTAQLLRESLVAKYARSFPTAVKCFEDDFDACTAHLRYPLAHRKYIRTTNLLERLFEEERRRMKIVSNAFGERAVLKLMYASLLRGSERWRGIRMSAFERRQLDTIREELNGHHDRRMASPIRKNETASPSRISSKDRT
jgi:transposase-like protein